MNPVDPATLINPLTAQWGAYGAILGGVSLAAVYLARALMKANADRITDLKENLAATLKNYADSTQALKDMKTTVDAVISMLKGRG